jgi:RNA polymerase sigma-70 factor (ECF subfamily)
VETDAHRRRQARPREVGDDVLAQIPTQDDEVDRALNSWLVSDALAALTPAHREVLVHTYFAGRTVAEAALALGVPPGTVKSRTHYALQALRLALLERGVTA